MGTLCGSTIMLLTLAWGGSVWLGRCDFGRRGHAVDKHLKRPADLTNTGVTCDRTTSMGARVMLLSVLLYLTVQVRGAPQSRDCLAERSEGLGSIRGCQGRWGCERQRLPSHGHACSPGDCRLRHLSAIGGHVAAVWLRAVSSPLCAGPRFVWRGARPNCCPDGGHLMHPGPRCLRRLPGNSPCS